MILRRDHVAGGVFVAGPAILFAFSGDLPFGSLSSPGPPTGDLETRDANPSRRSAAGHEPGP